MKASTAENFMRSAKAPTISVQVMPANVAWKAANTISGMTTPLLNVAALAKVPAALSQMPFMNSRSKPPMNWLPSVNARL
ncbi:MAG: hypothetical protein BWX79_02089 [Alphaproteobacteria bacterium ADurb.Bin100]|nr:MAG: hypothetical protein BWX79_02089 [Alphaproteobacteria bacterium ADurb.Bin100]